MSDTPRTDGCLEAILDAYGYVHQGNCPQRWVDHSRQLERELNAANAEIEEKRKDVVWLATEKAKLENRIRRLEEAGDKMEAWLRDERLDAVQHTVSKWNKAKEDKP